MHLHDLEKLNLIQEKSFPNDKRKKYFVSNAIYLAYSQPPLREQLMDNTPILNGGSLKERFFCTFRYGMEAYGINPRPILKRLGFGLGVKIGQELESDNRDGVLEELPLFWKMHELGDMTIAKGKRIEISVINCYNCGKMPNVGKTLCSMDEGIIEGILQSKLQRECRVDEIECYGTGHNNCRFIVEEKKTENK